MKRLILIIYALFINPLLSYAITVDVLHDAYINDFNSQTGVIDGTPDEILETNALLAGKGTLSDNKDIESRIVMSFDLQPYFGLTLDSATLTGYGRRVDAWESLDDPITLQMLYYYDDGEISLDDFSKSADAFGDLVLPNSPGWEYFDPGFVFFQLDATSLVQEGLTDNKRFLEIRAQTQQLTGYITAGEVLSPFGPDGQGRSGPQLVLNPSNVIPEPASLWMTTIGIVGLIFRRRKISRDIG